MKDIERLRCEGDARDARGTRRGQRRSGGRKAVDVGEANLKVVGSDSAEENKNGERNPKGRKTRRTSDGSALSRLG